MSDIRLIERWLPIAEIGAESLRERTPMTPFPAPNRLHVWWARRPLAASRAAILASLLPDGVDRDAFLHVLGIHGDPVAAQARIAEAKRTGERFEGSAYGYGRAFGHAPDAQDREWLDANVTGEFTVLDPTAGGGAIPFEAVRVGAVAVANDLNAVSALILAATVDWPLRHGTCLLPEFERLSQRLVETRETRLQQYFPREPMPDAVPTNFLYARTITCPYCAGLVPLSPNWRLASGGVGVRLLPQLGGGPYTERRVCAFEIVDATERQSEGTVARGDGLCPYSDCQRQINGDEIKAQAQAGRMGEQLYAVVYKQRVIVETKTGRKREKWVRGYRVPRAEDDNSPQIRAALDEKLPEWEAFDFVPSERFPPDNNDPRPIQYGMPLWRDLFSPRQLLCHGTGVEIFREMLEADRAAGELTEVRQAAYGYLALSLDKLRDYNSRMTRWHSGRSVMVNTFDRHDFAFKWSYAEMAPLVTGLGYDWAFKQTAKCIKELVQLVNPNDRLPDLFDQSAQRPPLPTTPAVGRASGTDLFNQSTEEPSNQHTERPRQPPPVTISCKSADSLDHIPNASIDVIVMDPPYYDNVMYAELSDFFYVWLKRTAGHVFPELFRRQFTDKENEAVANPARFAGEKGARALAGRDYQERMAAIFAECRRVLKANGIMTLMFTHKATGAWDALTKGLIEAGFVITASWPINTEAGGSLHIRNKAAANSTVFLACRPRPREEATEVRDAVTYWEDVEPRVAQAVRTRVAEFQEAGIAGVDLYLASFGPALEEFSRHWPLTRGTPRERPNLGRRRQQELLEEEWDPYAATPEDALDAARREVKRWRLEQLTHKKAKEDLDAVTAFFVLAWDAFRAPIFAYDEALRLARAVGVDMDAQVAKRLGEKRGSDFRLWDSATRAAKGTLGPVDGSRGMIDTLHHAANVSRTRSLAAARDLLADTGMDQDARLFRSFEAVLEVLPVSRRFTGVDLQNEAAASSNDFEALYNLSRLAYQDEVDQPKQLELWLAEAEAGDAA